MTTLGKNIKNTRKKLGITQEELAEKLNVTRQAVSNWENSKTEPDIETLTLMAQLFDISIDELVDGIPKEITELRGKKIHLKLGIIFTAFYVISTLLFFIINKPLQEYSGTTYNMLPYFIIGCIWKPLAVFSGGIGISSLIVYSTGFYVKNNILRLIFIIIGIACFLLTTAYLIYIPFVYRFGLSFILSPFYYTYLLEYSFLHIFGAVFLFFGLAKR